MSKEGGQNRDEHLQNLEEISAQVAELAEKAEKSGLSPVEEARLQALVTLQDNAVAEGNTFGAQQLKPSDAAELRKKVLAAAKDLEDESLASKIWNKMPWAGKK